MSVFLKLCGAAVLSVVAASLFREKKKEFASVVTLSSAILIFSGVFDSVGEITAVMRDVAAGTNASSYVPVLLKALGFAYITEISVGICRSSGEENLASAIEVAGKCEMIMLSLPYIRELVDTALGMLK